MKTKKGFISFEEMKDKWELEESKKLPIEKAIEGVSYLERDARNQKNFLKRLKLTVEGSKKLYLSETASNVFEPCPSLKDPKKKCSCSLDDSSAEDIKEYNLKHFNGKTPTLDVVVWGDRRLSDTEWSFVVDTKTYREKELKEESGITKEFDSTIYPDGAPDITHLVLDVEDITEDILKEAIKNFVKKFFKKDIEVEWVKPEGLMEKWDMEGFLRKNLRGILRLKRRTKFLLVDLWEPVQDFFE